MWNQLYIKLVSIPKKIIFFFTKPVLTNYPLIVQKYALTSIRMDPDFYLFLWVFSLQDPAFNKKLIQ
jgi:hypothetical protein